MEININSPASAGGGGSNAAAGTTGATAPTSASNTGFVDGSGNLQPWTGTVASGPIVQSITPDTTISANITAADAVVAAPAGDGTLRTGASTAGSLVALAVPGGSTAFNVMLTGTFSGTYYFEESLDSTNGTNGNWINVNTRQTGIVNTVLSGSATTAGFFRGNTSGSAYIRVRNVGGSAFTTTVKIDLSIGSGAVFLNASTPAGANIIGKVGIDQTTPGTTNLVALAANQSVNVSQMNGVTVTTGNGISGTGVQRVAVASDNTPFAVKVDQTTPGTTNAVSLAQVGANTVLTGNGVAGTGAQRVTIASDNTAFSVNATLQTGANVIGSLTANQSINNAQINGVTPLMGNGVTGTGSQRVTIASDNTAFSVNAVQSGTWTVQPGNTANTTAWLMKAGGKSQANAPVRNDYTGTSVTTGAYVQLVASTTSATSEIEIFDSSGQTLFLATGAAASEVNQILIFPGGNGRVPLTIAAGTRVSVKAASATASVGELDINFYT